MYSSQNSQYTLRKSFYMTIFLFLMSFSLFFLIGCKKVESTQSTADLNKETPTAILSNAATTMPSPTPTKKPMDSIALGEEVTIADAQAILEDRLDAKYRVELLSNDIAIEDTQYIAFIAHENSIPMEPVLIVNKNNGRIACMSEDGKAIAFSNFPYKKQEEIISYSWNGTYYMRDNFERIVATLMLVQYDNFSFEFIVQSTDTIASYTLSGIGHISKNSAVFTDEKKRELLFVMEEDMITLYDNQAFSKHGLSICGTYYFDSDNQDGSNLRITSEKALDLVTRLSMSETKLPAEISEYSLQAQEATVIVQDRISYPVGVYTQFEGHDVLVATFYVSVDGNVAFAFDNITKNAYATISL